MAQMNKLLIWLIDEIGQMAWIAKLLNGLNGQIAKESFGVKTHLLE